MFNWFGKDKKPEAPAEASASVSVKEPPEKPADGLSKIRSAMSLTGKSLVGKIKGLVSGNSIDDDVIDEIEETLIRADVGLDTAVTIADKLRAEKHRFDSTEKLIGFLKDEFAQILNPYQASNNLQLDPNRLNVYLMVGVNGSGKTTSIGKLAHRFVQQGHSVVIGAGDTFRAAAEDQLAIWAERAGATLVRKDGADPAAVIFEALQVANETSAKVVLLDTAGRLQNKFNLMEELTKIRGVIDKERPADSILETLLVLDATTGQNALKQAEVFQQSGNLTGVILTKLDGSAKGGVVLTIAQEHKLPVKLVGVGEGIEDLKDFETQGFLDGLFGES